MTDLATSIAAGSVGTTELADEAVTAAKLAPGAGAGLPARASATITTASLANGATGNTALALAKSYRLLTVQCSRAARVRVYTTTAARTADAARPVEDEPGPDAGVVLDFVAGDTAVHALSPLVDGTNLESTPVTSIPIAVTNDGTTGTVQVTVTYLATEA